MSKLQSEPAALRDYFLKTSLLIAMLSMPMVAFAFVSVRPLIELLLGSRWLGVVPIFQWLAVAAFFQPTFSFAASLLLSRGEGRKYFLGGCFNAICVSTAFVIGVAWGPVGVAAGYAIAGYVIALPWLFYVFSGTPISLISFMKICIPPTLGSAAGGVAAFLALGSLPNSSCSIQLCVAFVVTGSVALIALLSFAASRTLIMSAIDIGLRIVGWRSSYAN
jgi:PST family polysaccharide transporter